MDHIPDDLLELQARFDQWRANRKYNREPVPDQLRDAALEMKRRYPPSLLQRVLKIQLCRLMPKAKTHARRSKRQHPQTAFFKLPPPQASLAAEIRAHYNLKLADFFQIAAAMAAGCGAFLTNDSALKQVSEITIIVLDELEV
jgi:PIN domain-containing protein